MTYRLILTFSAVLAGLSAFEVKAETLRAYLMTAPASVNHSELHIINASARPQDFSGTLFGGDGSQLGLADTRLHGDAVSSQGRLILSSADLADIFDIEPWQGPAMLEVTAADEFKLMIKLRSPSGLVSNTNCVTRQAVHNIEGHDQPDQTFIRFINIGDTAINNIRGDLHQADGNRVGGGNRMLIESLGPKEQLWINNDDLAGMFGSTWSGPATLNVSEHANLRLLNLNFVNAETFFNFSCFESVEGMDMRGMAGAANLESLVGTWEASGIIGLEGDISATPIPPELLEDLLADLLGDLFGLLMPITPSDIFELLGPCLVNSITLTIDDDGSLSAGITQEDGSIPATVAVVSASPLTVAGTGPGADGSSLHFLGILDGSRRHFSVFLAATSAAGLINCTNTTILAKM